VSLLLILLVVVLVVVVVFVAGWSHTRPARRATGGRGGPQTVPAPGPAIHQVIGAPTHPAVPRPVLYDWAIEIPELAEPTVRGVAVGSGRLGWRGRRP